MKNKVTPFLMFDDQLEAAVEFYVATFPGSKVTSMSRGGKDGSIVATEFVVGGQTFLGFNGGPHFRFSEAFSMVLDCRDQEEVDEYWGKIVKAGGKPSRCGWITDPFGVSWQILPRRFTELIADKDPKKVRAVVAAMMKMSKLDVAALEKAYREA